MSIQSVSRAFTILRTVAHNPDGIGVTELARRMNVHKSTISRLLSTLEKENAVQRVPNGFRIGDGLVTLASFHSYPENIVAQLKPLLQKIVDDVDESVGLSVLDGWQTVSLAHVNSNHNIRVRDWTGERFPLHISSSGKHYLAHWPHFRREAYLARTLRSFTRYSLTEAATLRDRLVEVKQQGIDWTFDEFEEGLCAVSVPVFDQYERVVATIYVSGPIYRFPNRREEEITQIMLDYGRQASELVGRQKYQNDYEFPSV